MSMDAQTVTVFTAVVKELLPKLHARLAALAKMPATARACDSDCQQLIKELQKALAALGPWAKIAPDAAAQAASPATAKAMPKVVPTAAVEDEIDSEELDDAATMAMIAAMSESGPSASGAATEDDAGGGETADDEAMAMLAGMGTADADGTTEATDDEAAAMLAAMDAPVAPAAVATKARNATETTDDEAMAMLAAMDAPTAPAAAPGGEMDDDEAMAMLAAMDAPLAPEPAAAAGGEMDDDEAMAMLAAMDAPLAPEPAAAAGGEMNDDEAMAMLAAMDAPLDTKATAAAKPAKSSPSKAPAPAELAAMSADDEAMALLASLGGGEDDAQAEVPVQAAVPRAKAAATALPTSPAVHEAHGGHGGGDDEGDEKDLQEIAEFASNDFASDPDMLNDFVSNTDDLMQSLDEKILALEQNPRHRETIEEIFRAAHTLKGAAGMFGFKSIERVMHRMESLFDQVRKGVLIPDPNIIDVVLQGLDVLRTLLEAVKNSKPSGIKTVPIVRSLELASKGKYVKGSLSGSSGGAAAPVANRSVADAAEPGDHPAEAGGDDKGPKKKSTEQSTIRVDLERLDALVNLVGELVIDRTRFASIDDDIRTTTPQLKVAGNMSETVQLFGRHMNEIHDIIMKIRMVPIGNAFNKFTRIVRDIGRQLGKDMELYIDGEATELDKTLVEQIGDPLIHLIRNSCDHGIEMPDVRAANGKRRTGQISLSARQEGNHIIITIQDDGKGLPVEAIRKKAIEKGLITAEMALSKRDIFNLIFEPGFSTAEKVTNLSGRGVGMDVVRKQISKLKGLIDMDSEVGKGTTTTIRLPLTLAIMQSLLIDSAGECFAIPLSTVVESVRIKPEEIQFVGDSEVIKRHDRVLPLMYLHETLDLAAKNQISWYSARPQSEDQQRLAATRLARRKDRLYVVIVGSGDRRFGIVVDQLLTQQEMVIKSLGPVLRKTPCVAGGAVLGNGEVVLVLDVQELEDRFRSRSRGKAA